MIKNLLVSIILASSAAAMAADTTPTTGVQFSRDVSGKYLYVKYPLRVTFDSEQQAALEESIAAISGQLKNLAAARASIDPNGDLKAMTESIAELNSKLDLLVSLSTQIYGDVAPAGFKLFQTLPTGVIVFGGATADKNMFRFAQAGGSVVLAAVMVPMHVKRIDIATREAVEYIDWTDNSALVILPTISGGAGVSTDSATGVNTGGVEKKVRVGIGLIWGELNKASDLVGLTGGGSVTVDVGPGLNLKFLGLKNWSKPGYANNFIVLAGLQKNPGLKGKLPFLQVDAESSFNLGLIVDAGTSLAGFTKFTSDVADRITGKKDGAN